MQPSCIVRSALPFAIVMFVAISANAQNPDHVLSITGGFGAGEVDVSNIYDNTSAFNIAGWSWGNCIGDNTIIDIVAVVDGATSATIQDGAPPAFNAINVLPGQGWTIGVVINFFGDFPLLPGTGYELNVATYIGLAAGTSGVCYCDTLGMPTVQTTIVDSMGGSITPTTLSGMIEIINDPPFRFIAPNQDVPYDPESPDPTEFDETVAIVEIMEAPGFPNETAGFSMGLADSATQVGPTIDIEVINLDPQPLIDLLGIAPAFFGAALLADGWTVGVAYDFFGELPTPFPEATDVIIATYSVTGLQGDLDGATVNLDWSNDLGNPTVPNTVVVGADAFGVGFINGVITLGFDPPDFFIRGDCNDDSIVNIADGIFILNFQFQMGPAGNCSESCDANDDGMDGDLSDGVFIFNYRFLMGPPPPAPFPDCGIDAGSDCAFFNSCP